MHADPLLLPALFRDLAKGYALNVERSRSMDSDIREQLLYLLKFINYDIGNLVGNVLEDDEKDPDYSAVTAINMLACYMNIMRWLEEELPYSNVKEYFSYSWLKSGEYKRFMKSAKKESAYYRDKIFDETRKNIDNA